MNSAGISLAVSQKLFIFAAMKIFCNSDDDLEDQVKDLRSRVSMLEAIQSGIIGLAIARYILHIF